MKSFRIALLAALTAVAGLATAETPAAPSIPWKMPSYTLVARDMDLRMALDTFAVAQGLSVVMSDSVVGRFSGDFKDVPPDDFLDRIATTHNLMWYYDGAALYVYGASEITTMLVDLKYMKAGEVRQMLAETSTLMPSIKPLVSCIRTVTRPYSRSFARSTWPPSNCTVSCMP